MSEEVKRESEPEEVPEEQTSPPPRRRSVFVYLAILFGTAFMLLLFAYLMQQRDSEEIMGNLSQLRESMGSIQSIDQLVEENQQLREENEGLKESNEALQTDLDTAAANLAEAEAANQAAQEEWKRAYDKYAGYTSILEVLFTAEGKLAEKDYEAAAKILTNIEYQYFVETMQQYDAEIARVPEMSPLRPRFDALIEELTKHAALDESWLPSPPAESDD